MELNRKPTKGEKQLLCYLINSASVEIPIDWKDNLSVKNMDDGGMGSLLLFPEKEMKMDRKFGEQISECQFFDEDGVKVIASLYVDENGELFELDMWKTDFNSLIVIPSVFEPVS